MFFIATVLIDISTIYKSSLFSTSLLTLVIYCNFDNSYSNMCQTIYIFVVLILSALKISAIDHLFHVFVGHLCVFFGKTSI